MPTRKKRILTVITAAVVLLTLISIYLLGSTYAKYLSAGDGSASATVADWTVKFNGEADITNYNANATFGELSPSEEDPSAGDPKTNNSALALIAIVKIEDTTDVDAKIELSTASAKTYTKGGSDVTISGTKFDPSTGADPSKEQVDALFSLTFRYSSTYQSSPTTSNTTAYTQALTYTKSNNSTVTYYIYASLTWTTSWVDDETEHLLDTWVAENIDTVTATATATVTQTSSVPTD